MNYPSKFSVRLCPEHGHHLESCPIRSRAGFSEDGWIYFLLEYSRHFLLFFYFPMEKWSCSISKKARTVSKGLMQFVFAICIVVLKLSTQKVKTFVCHMHALCLAPGAEHWTHQHRQCFQLLLQISELITSEPQKIFLYPIAAIHFFGQFWLSLMSLPLEKSMAAFKMAMLLTYSKR